ncbi:MAG: ATP-binding cassette domain-containing protein [Bryobacteraceae bacterium]|nr:ATP-binding cassette domain-containing protein [Bryobacteraceae bacterium]
MVSVRGLTHAYNSHQALAGVSFEVSSGEIFGVLGPNGSGKSTLFRILSTLMAPASGSASIAGFDTVRSAASVRRNIGVVFQSQSLDRKLTAEENLIAQGHLFGFHGGALKARAAELLRRFHLTDRRGDLVETLSGGLRRRLEVAKALLHQPRVLLMDEPSSGLDPTARRDLWLYIEQLSREQGMTVLLTTHILDEAERCGRLLLLHEGRIVAQGAPAELKARIGGDVVVLEVDSPEEAARRLQERFGVQVRLAAGTVRVETANGHRFVAEAVEALGGQVRSVALHKPTLEDVFLDETGASIQA